MRCKPTDSSKGFSAVHASASAGIAAAAVCGILVTSSGGSDSPLGVPSYWAWLFTALQVLALWAAGRGAWWSWLLGSSVQIPWIVYAALTDQVGFIPGCALSAVVQLQSFLRSSRPPTSPRRGGGAAQLMEVRA